MTLPRAAAGSGPRIAPRRFALSVVACLVLAVVAIFLRLPQMNLGDFSSHASAVQRALHGDPVYTAVQLAGPYHLPDISRGRGFVYPPTAVVLLLPSALGSPWAVALLIGSLGLMTLVVTEIVRRELPRYAWIGWPVAGLLLISPIAGDAINAGQVTPLLAAGYGATWLWPRISGWVAVAGGALKLYPLVLLAWAVRNGVRLRWPVALGVALVVVATLWLGLATWQHFWTAWQNALPQCTPPSLGSAACAFGRPGELVALGAALALALIATRFAGPAVAFLMVAVASVVAAPDIFPNYLLIVAIGVLPIACGLAARATPTAPVTALSVDGP